MPEASRGQENPGSETRRVFLSRACISSHRALTNAASLKTMDACGQGSIDPRLAAIPKLEKISGSPNHWKNRLGDFAGNLRDGSWVGCLIAVAAVSNPTKQNHPLRSIALSFTPTGQQRGQLDKEKKHDAPALTLRSNFIFFSVVLLFVVGTLSVNAEFSPGAAQYRHQEKDFLSFT